MKWQYWKWWRWFTFVFIFFFNYSIILIIFFFSFTDQLFLQRKDIGKYILKFFGSVPGVLPCPHWWTVSAEQGHMSSGWSPVSPGQGHSASDWLEVSHTVSASAITSSTLTTTTATTNNNTTTNTMNWMPGSECLTKYSVGQIIFDFLIHLLLSVFMSYPV